MIIYLAGGISGNLKPIFTETMKIYLAGQNGRRWCIEEYWKLFIKQLPENQRAEYLKLLLPADAPQPDSFWKNNSIYVLESFFYNDDWVEKHIPLFKDFLLDSGAFTFFTNKHIKADWESYVDRYAAYIVKNDIKHFFELDIDSIVGYEKVLELRKRLEEKAGRPCIPVWHKSRGKEEFLKMCDEYKYVAVGGIVSKEITSDQYPIFTWLINEAHKRGCKIHGLGFTNLEGLKKYNFDSVDSTSWTTGNRFGSVYHFNGKTMDKYDKKPGQKLADAKTVAIHNFLEWVKFQKYADIHL